MAEYFRSCYNEIYFSISREMAGAFKHHRGKYGPTFTEHCQTSLVMGARELVIESPARLIFSSTRNTTIALIAIINVTPSDPLVLTFMRQEYRCIHYYMRDSDFGRHSR